jgi:hypothetical protein
MRIVISFACILLLALGLACNGNGTDSGTSAAIDSKITMTPSEVLNPAQRTLRLSAATEHIYGCVNYSIANDYSMNGTAISLNFTGINEPSVCLTALGPAAGVIDLGSLASAAYTLTITVNSVATHATLVVTDTSYQILNGSSEWTDFSKTSFLKVPQGVIWGNIQYGDPSFLNTYSAFIDSLTTSGAQLHVYPAGDYNYFQIDALGEVVPPPPPHPNFVKTFIYSYNLDMLKVRALVKSFAAANYPSMSFNLYGSNGEVYIGSVLIHE